MEAQVGEHLDIDTGAAIRSFDIPLLAIGSDIAIIGKLQVLHIKSDGETEVPALEVGIRAIKHLIVILSRRLEGHHKGTKQEYPRQKERCNTSN